MRAQALGLWAGADYLAAGGRLAIRHADDSITLRWPMKAAPDPDSVTLNLPAARLVDAGAACAILKL